MSGHLTELESSKFVDFLVSYRDDFMPTPSMPLYHYTSGSKFIDIVQSGDLWSTHVACLNDTMEMQYAFDAFRMALELRQMEEDDEDLTQLYKSLLEQLETPVLEIRGFFVACFSAARDDLTQWRSYTGGESGYAIEFDPIALRSKAPKNTYLLKVCYDRARQAAFLENVIDFCGRCYQRFESRKTAPDRDLWRKNFARSYLEHTLLYAVALKHPAYASEQEYRLFRAVDDENLDQLKNLKFVQRGTLMSRHLPLGFQKEEPEHRLPITGVTLGPCRYPEVTMVAVNDLLANAGYDIKKLNVVRSSVPYRTI